MAATYTLCHSHSHSSLPFLHLLLALLLTLALPTAVLCSPVGVPPSPPAASAAAPGSSSPDTDPIPSASSSDLRPTVTVDAGILAGTSTTVPWSLTSTTTVSQFLGVRFGAPPARFRPPQAAQSWSGAYDASRYGATCIQQFSGTEAHRLQTMRWFNTPAPPTKEAEDCLFLNVFAPAGAANASKPVMFWIYGGSFTFGSGALPMYDGTGFAANQDVVLVTFNYRTNIFGFPGAPDIPREEQNVGLMDQRLALDWVRRNIHVFGGDPDRITIFGESAGGQSVNLLVTAPPMPVPFVAAIIQSSSYPDPDSNSASASSWRKAVTAANCAQANGLECLSAVPATFLKSVIEKGALVFAPTPDGGVTFANDTRRKRLRSKPDDDKNSSSDKQGIARVPLLIGTNSDEGSLYVYGNDDIEDYLNARLSPATPVSTLIANNTNTNTSTTASAGFSDRDAQISKLFTQIIMQCPAGSLATESSNAGIPTWRYLYDASFPNTEQFPGSGAYHSAEIATVFGTFPATGTTAFQLRLSRYMQKAWADFAKNPAGGPGWPALPQVAVLGEGAKPGVSDEGRKLAVIEPASRVDPNCRFYRLLYSVLAPFF